MVHQKYDAPVIPPTEFLSRDELRDLTGVARAAAQGRWLTEKGVPHHVDGRRVIVSRHHVRLWLEGKHELRQRSEPNWDPRFFSVPSPPPRRR